MAVLEGIRSELDCLSIVFIEPTSMLSKDVVLGLIFCVFFSASTLRSEVHFDNNKAAVICQLEDVDVESFEQTLQALEKSALAGDAQSFFDLGHIYQYGHGTSKDFSKALDYYEKALEIDPELEGAWLNIGLLYEYGGVNFEKDYRLAARAYLRSINLHPNAKAYFRLYVLAWDGDISVSHSRMRHFQEQSAELGHPVGAYYAARHYFYGIRDAKDREKAAYFYELAHKNGREGAAYTAAYNFRYGRDGGASDYVLAAKFYEMGAELLEYYCMYALSDLASEPSVIEHFGEEKAKKWRHGYRQQKNKVRQQAFKDAKYAQDLFNSGKLDEASSYLVDSLERCNESYNGEWDSEYTGALWWDAQTRNGRTDLEWGRYLFAWLADEVYSGPKVKTRRLASWHMIRIGVRTNLSGRLISLGRFGVQRKRTEEIRRQILSFDGVSVEQVLADHSIDSNYQVSSTETLPIFIAEHPKRRIYDKRSDRDMLCGYTIESMEPQALAAMSLGDWESALIYAAWIERWISHIDTTGRTPEYDYPGYYGDIKEMIWALRARVFVALGLPDLAADEYRKSIEANFKEYKGRAYHRSNLLLGGYLVDSGRASEVDLENLQAVENAMLENRFAESHEWQFAKLVRARVLAETESFVVGKALVDEVLEFTDETHLPLLRLEALLVASEMCMSANQLLNVELWLTEALGWAREQGLLFEELRIYQLYVSYLIKTGNFELALDMQRRVLELIDGLKLEPRRQLALLRLSEIYARMGEALEAQTLLGDTASEAASGGSVLEDILETESSSSVVIQSLDLQPLRIVSEPIHGECDAIFILSNPSPEPVSASLELHSKDFVLSAEDVSTELLSFELHSGSGFDRVAAIRVPGLSQLPIMLTAMDLEPSAIGQSVQLAVQTDGLTNLPSSEWILQAGSSTATVAVIDAAHIRDNAFYLVPVYHHISMRGEVEKPFALRAVASKPTRIECYDSDGSLIFVDAEGNGSFADAGDLVATELLYELSPALEIGQAGRRVEMRYQPIDRGSSERIEVRIELHTTEPESDWETDVIDWLER